MSDEVFADEDGDSELLEVDSEIETGEETISDLAKLLEENTGYLADLQRVQAEFDNFRRQTAKRQTDLVEQAASSLVEKLLPVLDACDAAIQQGANDINPIRNSLLETLQSQGLEIIAEASVNFDPEHHEAVMHETTEDSDVAIVAEVMRSGYLWKGRTIRPAMVRTTGPA
ncbi:MAG: nucleotide exchange factor GrpE [Acidimicrobiales bacterium]|jgi:molecular chaperone GrpE|nr:nucleotide exchange factor GrpE [Acidimicrobiales bacterium]MDP6299216.1 nucleotide exchange factor GrpE [Acidimicrobiales bacterium]HJM28310.1 nucleotide exchange factor GrpE [Acidimicrobiales bacterium]HJM98047.1 nucleotide exchange factor GrpE [Acidimicrobiales bacterium]